VGLAAAPAGGLADALESVCLEELHGTHITAGLVGSLTARVDRPILDEAGFSEFTGRKAWRQSEHTIDHVQLPQEVYQVLVEVVEAMREGKAITSVPRTQRLTTQEAADFLGISRPTLVKFLEDGKIPYEQPGTAGSCSPNCSPTRNGSARIAARPWTG
jgi:excisionase family DNA binding protein